MPKLPTLIEHGTFIWNSQVDQENSWIRYGSSICASVIGNNVFVGFRGAITHASIGSYTQIAAKVNIKGVLGSEVSIGPYCWLGAGVTVEAGVSIEEGAVIGAGAYVDRNIPPYVVCAGRPAKVIKERNCVKDESPDFSQLLLYAKTRQYKEEGATPPEKAVQNCFITADVLFEGRVEIGSGAILIGRRHLSGNGGIKVGKNVRIGKNVIIEAAGGINIGDRVVIEDGAMLVTTSHLYKFLSLPVLALPLTIDSGTIIGPEAIVVGGISIGANARIRQESVVINPIPAGVCVMGVPAKIVGSP